MKLILIVTSLFFLACQKDPGSSETQTPEVQNPGSTAGTNYSTDIIIQSVVASPTESESVTLKNTASAIANISGWTIGDLNAPDAYKVPDGTAISPGQVKTFSHKTLHFQVNDSGEKIFLKNPAGVIIATWTN
jgi:hypothetical protein